MTATSETPTAAPIHVSSALRRRDPLCRRGGACDDGNQDSGDGCDAECRLEACGNGRLDAGERCDDGNRAEVDDKPE